MGWIWLLIFLLTHFDWASSLIVLVSILMSGCVITKVVNNFGLYFILFFLVKFLESHLNNLLKLLNFFIHFDVENIVLVVADFADFLPDFFEPFIFQLPLFLLLVLPFPHFFLFSGFIINPRFLWFSYFIEKLVLAFICVLNRFQHSFKIVSHVFVVR